MVAILLVSPPALAFGNVFGALALGAGGGDLAARAVVASSLAHPDATLGGSTCVARVAILPSGTTEVLRPVLSDGERIALARALVAGNGTLPNATLVGIEGNARIVIATTPCPGLTAATLVLGECALNGRDCRDALVLRAALDANADPGARVTAIAALGRVWAPWGLWG